MNKKIIVIYPASIHERSARIDKLIKLFQQFDIEFEIWYWERNKNNELINIEHINTRILLKGGGENNKYLFVWYIIWFLKLFFLVAKSRDINFYSVGLISSLPLFFNSIFRKVNYIFDNNDNFSKSYKFPRTLKKILNILEKNTVKNAQIHIVPGHDRWKGYSNNLKIVKNTPLRETLQTALEIRENENISKSEIFTIYVNGWLTDTRGMEIFLRMLNAIKCEVKVILAGKLISESAKTLSKLDNVIYLGMVSQEYALAYYFASHVTFTFYDPTIEINRLAEPNKWMDCILTTTPFIVNSEVLTAKYYLDKDMCFAVKYNDLDGLIQLVSNLSHNRAMLNLARKNLAKEKVLLWDETMMQILKSWI